MSSLVPDQSQPAAGRPRSRSHSRNESASQIPQVREPTYAYPEDDLDDRYRRRPEPPTGGALPYPDEGGIHSMLPGDHSLYNYQPQQPIYHTVSPPVEAPYRTSRDKVQDKLPGAFPDDRRSGRDDEDPRIRYAEPRDDKYGRREDDDKFKYLPQKYSQSGNGADKTSSPPQTYSQLDGGGDDDKFHFLPKKYSRKLAGGDGQSHSDREDKEKRSSRKSKDRYDDDLAYGKPPVSSRPKVSTADLAYGKLGSMPTTSSSIPAPASIDQGFPYVPQDEALDRTRDDYRPSRRSRGDSVLGDPRDSAPNVLTVDPGDRERRRSKSPGPDLLTVDSSSRKRDKSRDRSRDRRRDKSPGPDYLGVESDSSRKRGKSRERSRDRRKDDSLDVDSGRRHRDRSSDRRRSHRDKSPQPPTGGMSSLSVDPGRLAGMAGAAGLTVAAAPASPLLESYRGTYQDCSSVNVAKHIRSRLKDEDPLLMKACYTVALGKWESEAYWANFWYQGDKTRRELLIESLMGRTNEEIWHIKDSFTDKKYDNSLTQCMKTELKEDKFKKAVLTALEGRRMDDFDHQGRPLPLDYDLLDHDVEDLRRAIKAEKGGESLMISIIVQRSDNHLRAILQEYERHYRSNFARDALKKSGNLVGELLAHILNGVINRPVRDALLLQHALTASRKDGLRRELLISRLVRYHWDPHHMRAVKHAYRERYGKSLRDALRAATSSEWGLFCEELCIARMPDDVRRFEKVNFSER